MKKFDDLIYRFGLHDTEISGVAFVNGGVLLLLEDGVYFLDEVGKETNKTSSCKIFLKICI